VAHATPAASARQRARSAELVAPTRSPRRPVPAPPRAAAVSDAAGRAGRARARRSQRLAGQAAHGLRKTGSNIAQAFVGATIDDAMYEDLEAALLQADAGVAATRHLLDDLQARDHARALRDPAKARRLLADCIAELLRRSSGRS
jgi:fused signal recognition particle receptor